MKKIGLLLLCSFVVLCAQAQGIRFETGSWKEVLAKAKKEKKLIYMDIYTTWCGPCKIMAKNIFPAEAAGNKYNATFVNYKIDAEKGEGIDLAKQYKVEGYPTNLYIDPNTQNVVYRVMGACEMDEFLGRAETALLEQKDPMKWADYEAQLAKGKKDKAFLVAYLAKAKRLDHNGDKGLDIYVAQFVPAQPDDETLKFLTEYTQTLDNKAVPVIYANKEKVSALYPDMTDYFYYFGPRLAYNTLSRAIETKDENLLKLIDEGMRRYDISAGGLSGMHYFYKEYFGKTGNGQRAWEAAIDEANYLLELPSGTYAEYDKAELKRTIDGLIYQLKAMKVPDEKYDASIEATLAQHPDMRRSATLGAAEALNESAWKVVERKKDDPAAVAMAAKWSDKAMALAGKDSESWPMLADTHANLLYLSGDKEKAITLEAEAVASMKDMPEDAVASMKETLEKMKAGTL
ncbi:thioredoxin family protein [Taibaiella koreensis]|uniref:thioredoxin family protein n=1 Tax=Taibaiella koreensis TaxID=1268548 RepID=UPI000E5994C1|nr:thioredoxin domain-containing protein [Taibaiella koreensis]